MRKFSFLAMLIVLMASNAYADDSIDAQNEEQSPYILSPVVVTADKRAQDIQNVPSSVTAITNKMIEDFQIEQTSDIFKVTPNVMITKVGPKGVASSFASVRGIASSMGNSPVLGVYVDDVYYPYLDMSLLDIEQIEVLRGPQGTLYGRNTEAGVINIITQKPTQEWQSKIGGSYSSYNTREFTASTSGQLIDDLLGFRGTFRYEASDGYFTNKFNDNDKINNYENYDGRLRFSGTPTSRFKYDLTFDIQDYRSGGYADFAPIDSANLRKSVNVDYDGYSWKKNYVAAFRGQYDWDDMTLLSVTSFKKDQSVWDNDTDFGPIDIYRIHATYDTTNISQELRLSSTNESSPFQWLIGGYGYYEEDERGASTRMNLDNMGMTGMGIATSLNKGTIDTTGAAIFGQGTYTFFDDLDLTLGLRYEHLYRKLDYEMDMGAAGPIFGMDNVSGTNNKKFDALLPKIALSYRINENIKPYASVSRGFREGGFNITNQIGTSYDSEFTWNYEIGTKTQWLNNALTLNLAAFWIDWKDRQVEILSPDGSSFYIQNAGKATSKGVELEAMYRVMQGLDLNASFGYTYAKYDDYSPSEGEDYAGKFAVDSPRYTARIGATYRFLDHWLISAAYTRYGKTYFDPANTVSQSDYQTVDLKFGYEADDYEVYLWAKNIFNEDYVTRACKGALSDGWYARPGEPLTIGVSAAIKF